MTYDAWSLLVALAVVLLPLVLAGILLARPPGRRRVEAPPSENSKENP